MGYLLKHLVFLLGLMLVPKFVGSLVISKQRTSLYTRATSVDKLTTVSYQMNNNHPILDTTLDTDELVQCDVPKMIPLCQSPLLLESSAPIIAREECSILIQHFEQHQTSSAEAILQNIHNVIAKVTNCPRHDGGNDPRYVRYDTKIIQDIQHMQQLQLNPKSFTDNLLPDGLHVDTNNGMLFRHITAILYLTDNVDDGNTIGGGTTFPLAIQQSKDDYNREQSEVLLTSAKTLLLNGIHHTKGDENQDITSNGRVLENAGMQVFCRDTKQIRHTTDTSGELGVRVMPRAGKLIYFHNVDDDGLPDANSFHGGEELSSFDTSYAAESKSILVFFKEVPLAKFRDSGIKGFAKEVAKSRSWTKSTY